MAGRKLGGRAKRRFMDFVKDDYKFINLCKKKEDAQDEGVRRRQVIG